jgi:hypothetical protein
MKENSKIKDGTNIHEKKVRHHRKILENFYIELQESAAESLFSRIKGRLAPYHEGIYGAIETKCLPLQKLPQYALSSSSVAVQLQWALATLNSVSYPVCIIVLRIGVNVGAKREMHLLLGI